MIKSKYKKEVIRRDLSFKKSRVPQKEEFHRRSIRLKGYDYSKPGQYFVTICTQDKACLFGHISKDTFRYNQAGHMIQGCWDNIPNEYPHIQLRDFILMPNHLHGIIQINEVNPILETKSEIPDILNRTSKEPPHPFLGEIIGGFKSITTGSYIHGVKLQNWPRFNKRLWQRNYFEHIIRHPKAFNQIANYINANPINWKEDPYFQIIK